MLAVASAGSELKPERQGGEVRKYSKTSECFGLSVPKIHRLC